MRTLPDEMAARLARGVTTLAHVWRIERRDGRAFAFTDHDEPIVFGDLTCEPSAGLSAGAVEKGLGLNIDTAGTLGALSSDAVAEADLSKGLWDGARVDLYRIDWTDPTLRAHLFAGHIGEVRRGVQAFEAELRGLQAALNVPVGRVFSRFCDADVGDARCTVDLDAAAFRGEGIVVEIISTTAFRASGLNAFAETWFARGRLSWDGGGEGEVAAHRVDGADAIIELLDVAGPALGAGAHFVLRAGCDKRFTTCRAKFDNTMNFRGFPHMPGNDAVVSGPAVGEPLDGSSRFS